MDDLAIQCAECSRGVDEFTTIAEGWRYYSDGRDLYPYCPACASEFAEDAPGSGVRAEHRRRER